MCKPFSQALLASEYTKKNYKQARIIVYRVLQVCIMLLVQHISIIAREPMATSKIQREKFVANLVDRPLNHRQVGTTTGIALSVLLFFGFEPFSTLFTTDFSVLQIASSGVLVKISFHYC